MGLFLCTIVSGEIFLLEHLLFQLIINRVNEYIVKSEKKQEGKGASINPFIMLVRRSILMPNLSLKSRLLKSSLSSGRV